MIKIKQKRLQKTQIQTAQKSKSEDQRQPFVEHLLELRKRLLFVAIVILFLSGATYFVQQSIVSFLLRPAHNQHFIYTSPGGGIGFLFQVCTYAGITASIPVLIYQILRFLEPVIGDNERRFIIKMSWFSGLLAILGFSFGYTIGLPAALHFLGHQFTTTQIQPLLTLQEYMTFITVYLIGSALIFQLPLIVVFINRIKPLKPSQLFKCERYVIGGAFIVSMLMAPTVNLVDQLILAGPIIIIYQIAIGLVVLTNRHKRPSKVMQFIEQDKVAQTARQEKAAEAMPITPLSAPPTAMRRSYSSGITTPPIKRPVIRPTPRYRPVMDFDFYKSPRTSFPIGSK
jgi:sec-independent protein translocase protein TatC